MSSWEHVNNDHCSDDDNGIIWVSKWDGRACKKKRQNTAKDILHVLHYIAPD